MRASNLIAVLASFVPSGMRKIERVSLYPSELEGIRMERQEMEGLPRIYSVSRSG